MLCNENMKIAVVCEKTKICDYLPNSVKFYSCNIKCEKIVNLCNKLYKLDTNYNTLLKYLSIPHKIKSVVIKRTINNIKMNTNNTMIYKCNSKKII